MNINPNFCSACGIDLHDQSVVRGGFTVNNNRHETARCVLCNGKSSTWTYEYNVDTGQPLTGYERDWMAGTRQLYYDFIKRAPYPPNRLVTYAAGFEDGQGGYGMFSGPVTTVEELVSPPPPPGEDDNNALLFRFNPDGTEEIIADWDGRQQQWIYRE